jgi:hypothetical protein
VRLEKSLTPSRRCSSISPRTRRAIRHDLLLEMGDVMYYFLKLKEIFGFTLEEILEANKSKLFERHGIKE